RRNASRDTRERRSFGNGRLIRDWRNARRCKSLPIGSRPGERSGVIANSSSASGLNFLPPCGSKTSPVSWLVSKARTEATRTRSRRRGALSRHSTRSDISGKSRVILVTTSLSSEVFDFGSFLSSPEAHQQPRQRVLPRSPSRRCRQGQEPLGRRRPPASTPSATTFRLAKKGGLRCENRHGTSYDDRRAVFFLDLDIREAIACSPLHWTVAQERLRDDDPG